MHTLVRNNPYKSLIYPYFDGMDGVEMLKSYPKFKRFEGEKIFKKLSKSEQKLIEDYLFYRQSCGLQNVLELRRMILQIRHIIEVDFKKFKDLNQHTRLVVLINQSYWSDSVKKNLKIDLNNFFGEYLFPKLWTKRFERVYSNKNAEKGKEGKKKIDIPSDEEIEKLINTENSTYWKTFLLVQAGTGARTKEVRCIEIKRITYNSDGTTTIEIHMTKTGKDKVVFVDSQTTFWIKKLIKEYEDNGKLGKYLFQQRGNPDKPISRSIVNYWFKSLSQKATGKHYIPYSLRHRKATQLYKLAKNNQIAESTALKLMGHSKSQMGTYDHTPKEEDIRILKEQAFNLELSPERKHELELKIDNLTKIINLQIKYMELTPPNKMTADNLNKEDIKQAVELHNEIVKIAKGQK